VCSGSGVAFSLQCLTPQNQQYQKPSNVIADTTTTWDNTTQQNTKDNQAGGDEGQELERDQDQPSVPGQKAEKKVRA
jgi:hypothetical protein